MSAWQPPCACRRRGGGLRRLPAAAALRDPQQPGPLRGAAAQPRVPGQPGDHGLPLPQRTRPATLGRVALQPQPSHSGGGAVVGAGKRGACQLAVDCGGPSTNETSGPRRPSVRVLSRWQGAWLGSYRGWYFTCRHTSPYGPKTFQNHSLNISWVAPNTRMGCWGADITVFG